jgi:hypothetical protein
MRLTWRDGLTTALLGAVVAIVVATTRDLGWPLLGSYRSAGLVLFAVGMAMCTLGGSAESTPAARKDPYVAISSALGGLALLALVVVLITASEAWFIVLAVDIAALWAISTLRHAVRGPAPRQAGLTA